MKEEEIKFMEYWEQNRDRQGKWYNQLLAGLPWGLIFGLPMIINMLVGREWYKNLPYISPGEVDAVLAAVAVIIVFYAMFRKKFQWEQYEQQYEELKARQKAEANTKL